MDIKKKKNREKQKKRTVYFAKFYPKKKKKTTDRQKQKKTKSWPWNGEGQFCPTHSSSFSLHFGEIEFWWAQKENSWAPPLFSPPPPLNQTPFPLIFSPIFHSFFPSSLKSTQPNIPQVIFGRNKNYISIKLDVLNCGQI